MTKKNTVTIAGNIAYTAVVNDALAARIIAICAEVDSPAPQLAAEAPPAVSGAESIVEYMDRLKPKRNPDKILAIAAYISAKDGQRYFSPQEIRSYFPKANESAPANFNRDFAWALTTKWLAAADDKRDAYFVTNKGMEVVEGGFPKALVKETRGKSSGRTSVRKN